ncbi:putative short-chain dehydrogenase/reductase [Hypoxylon trugodes]|uniref:putative short-chain dehydrogenase/reductase n=1 Tax=Hypoxylon trugodes TaxID=326681 RepID=UPI00219FA2BA|nr:putative short-chain dehydrogenase/reductase [Hypoxylon trugodes]KAI1385392.1 putative short-chain dehydrogenase/reductase [Hypoxylon trugodes]
MPLKTVLITGCGPGGIGSALAMEFHLRGHRVIATGLSESLLTHMRERGIETVILDVTSRESIDQAMAHVSKLTHGSLDILINNAGIMHNMPFTDTDVAAARKVLEVNVLGVISVTQAFLPLLLAAAKKHGDALVANIGSINTEIRPPFFSIYNASKAAIEVLGASIRTELAPFGVRVVTVKTGSIKSELFNNAPPTKLPENSLYLPAKEYIESRIVVKTAATMEADEYAKKVVSQLLKSNVKPIIWTGGLAMLAWALSWFGWEGMMDGIIIKESQLDKCIIR